MSAAIYTVQTRANQIAGFNIQISTMYSINKQVFILKKGIWRKVPNKLKNFDSIFDVMQSVVIMKVDFCFPLTNSWLVD